MDKTLSLRGTLLSGEPNLIFDCENPFKKLITQKDVSHGAVVTSVYVLYIKNETKYDFTVTIDKLFEGNNLNQDVKHEDDTGCLKILCPANFDGTVDGVDSLIYKPRLNDDILREYSGLELPEDENQLIFEKQHPIVHFIMHHTPNPQYTQMENGYIKFEKEYLDKMKLYFKTTVLNHIHVTRFENTRVGCGVPEGRDKPSPGGGGFVPSDKGKEEGDKPSPFGGRFIPPSITFIIQMNYILIMPGENKMKHLAIKL